MLMLFLELLEPVLVLVAAAVVEGTVAEAVAVAAVVVVAVSTGVRVTAAVG